MASQHIPGLQQHLGTLHLGPHTDPSGPGGGWPETSFWGYGFWDRAGPTSGIPGLKSQPQCSWGPLRLRKGGEPSAGPDLGACLHCPPRTGCAKQETEAFPKPSPSPPPWVTPPWGRPSTQTCPSLQLVGFLLSPARHPLLPCFPHLGSALPHPDKLPA